MRERKIIHIDMDAFYAAVEQRDNPELRGKPIAVGRAGARSVVATASYEARQFGIHSAMPSLRAARLCPQLIFVTPRFDVYKQVSAQIHGIFHDYTDMIEPIALDEAFLDVTTNKTGQALAVDIAKELKQRIHDETGLVASAGVSYNKFLAKIASDYRKPDGLCTIHPTQAQRFIDSLPIERFWGIGPVTAKRMHQLGIHTGAQLRETPRQRLIRFFGKAGRFYHDFAHGIDLRPVVPVRIRKSLGCERTLDWDVSQQAEMKEILQETVKELIGRIGRYDFHGLTLTLKVKFNDFSQITRSITQEQVLDDAGLILHLAEQLLADVDYENHPIRLIGLTVSHSQQDALESYSDLQFSGTDEWRQLDLPFMEW